MSTEPLVQAAMTDAFSLHPRKAPEVTHRRRNILLGVVLGAVVGGFVGYKLEASSCKACDFGPPLFASAAVGALAGGLIGGGIAAITTSSRSIVHTPAPVRLTYSTDFESTLLVRTRPVFPRWGADGRDASSLLPNR